MTDVFRKVFSLLDAHERRRFVLLTLLMIFVALVEVAGVSSVLILLNVLADPTSISSNATLSAVRDSLGLQGLFSFQVVLSLAVICIIVLGLVIKAIGTYAIVHFSYLRGASIATRLIKGYLNQPYAWYLERNSSEIGKNVLSEVDNVVGRVITPLLRLTSNIFIVVATIGFLLVVDPQVTILSSVVLGGSYAMIYLRLRGSMHRAGEDLMQAVSERFRIAQEATGGIKDVKLLGLEEVYAGQFSRAAGLSARSMVRIGIMSELPRFMLEAITFGGLLGLVLLLLFRSDGNIAGIVPTLGVFAFSVMRLLPALQQIYNGMATIRGGAALLDSLATDYTTNLRDSTTSPAQTQALQLHRQLDLAQIGFKYASAERQALTGLDLTIPARTTIGIVGGTGAGKTTLIDLILGLLTPDTGQILVDGTPVNAENLRAWQKTLGYVPQAIYLSDDTIAANIAFGLPAAEIDWPALEHAARAAALHDFVMSDLPQGYDTIVGERGVRLSGGQRQRIGIARALYRSPSLLIMDEATSALDNITERVVMEAVHNIRSDTTIILIAHRLSTVKDCDRIFLMEKGRIAASGTYHELVQSNATFRAMAVGA